MQIGILGSGLMGGTLGTLFARAGHDVAFSYSRSAARLDALARHAGGRARAGAPAEAARDADVVLLAVPWGQVDDVLHRAGDLTGKVLVTCSLPLDGHSAFVVAGTSSGAEETARKAPGARVVSAFGTLPHEVLVAVFEARDRAPRPGLVYCGDDAEAKEVTAQLIRDVGYEPEDAGGLRMARYAEAFTMLVARLAYEGEGGPALAYRFERY